MILTIFCHVIWTGHNDLNPCTVIASVNSSMYDNVVKHTYMHSLSCFAIAHVYIISAKVMINNCHILHYFNNRSKAIM